MCDVCISLRLDDAMPSRWASKMKNWTAPRWWQWMGARCVVGSLWCYYMTDLARRESFLLLLQASMPAAMTMASTGFSSQIFAPLAAFLQDPRGLVPPKWAGRLHATALVMANWTCNHPHLGSLAVSCHICTHRLVVTPRVCTCALVLAP